VTVARCRPRYFVLANMLMESRINPFDAQETKPFEHDPDVAAMTAMTEAYLRRDARAFEQALRGRGAAMLEDAFMKEYIEELLRTTRSQVLVDLIRPYAAVRLTFLAHVRARASGLAAGRRCTSDVVVRARRSSTSPPRTWRTCLWA
jgi:hypothetical protein